MMIQRFDGVIGVTYEKVCQVLRVIGVTYEKVCQVLSTHLHIGRSFFGSLFKDHICQSPIRAYYKDTLYCRIPASQSNLRAFFEAMTPGRQPVYLLINGLLSRNI